MDTGHFSQILQSISGENGAFKAEVTAVWLQGRAAFGGLVAALSVEAMIRSQSTAQPLRAIQVLFASAVSVGTVNIDVQLIRQGKSVTTMRADLSQDGQLCSSVMASFGASRSSAIVVSADPRPEVTPPEGLEVMPYVEGLFPDFFQHFEIRWAEGEYPFSNSPGTHHGLWIRFKEQGDAKLAHLIAIADVPPPIPLSMIGELANGSSLSWSLSFLADDWQAQSDDWWFVETSVTHCEGGYNQQQYKVWSPDGRPVASGQQVMTIFA